MRILYGVCGIGLGHATRSLVSIQHLRARGHDVLVCASGGALALLRENLPHALGAPSGAPTRVLETFGVEMKTYAGAFDLPSSFRSAFQRLPDLLAGNGIAWRSAEGFRPQAVITDHDGFAMFFAKAKGLPAVSIDNSQIVLRCDHPASILGAWQEEIQSMALRVGRKISGCDHYVITSFFFPPVRDDLADRVAIVPPILRREILGVLQGSGQIAKDAHVLVYASLAASREDPALLEALAAFPRQRFVVYGLEGLGQDLPPNCAAKPTDKAAFVQDLASARAVVGNGGMSLIGEALALGKPVYAVPLRGQYEQVINAAYLADLGYGVMADRFDVASLGGFIANLPLYAEKIRGTPQHDGNTLLYQTLDRLFS